MAAYLFAGGNDLVIWGNWSEKRERTIAETVLAKAREARKWYTVEGLLLGYVEENTYIQ